MYIYIKKFILLKIHSMKKIIFSLVFALLLSSCTDTTEINTVVVDSTDSIVENWVDAWEVVSETLEVDEIALLDEIIDAGSSNKTPNTKEENITSSNGVTKEFIETHYADSLVWDVSIVDCTLSGGSETECFRFTVAPDATTDHEIGPWCPRNVTDDETAGWIWPDDGKIYEVGGEFVENLAVFYDDDNWSLYNTETGEINVTDTQISCEWAAKPDVEDEYKNHCVECSLSYMDEIPNVTYTIPMNPIKADSTQQVNNQLWVWVAFNGTKFDASAPTENILAANTIAPFDDCGWHINLNVGYHYHESTGCSKQIETIEWESPMIGIALDGFPMHQQAEDTSWLDACGGQTVDGQYFYNIAATGSNQFLGCYVWEYWCTSDDADAVCDASASSQQGPGWAGWPGWDRPDRPER